MMGPFAILRTNAKDAFRWLNPAKSQIQAQQFLTLGKPRGVGMSKQLTDKHEMFCQEYLIDLNASAAAERAGYKKSWARSNTPRLMANDDISNRIQELKETRSASLKVSAEWVLKECVDCYEYNKEKVVNQHGQENMRNPTVAAKFLELAGKHIGVKAFDTNYENKVPEPLKDLTLDQLIELKKTLESYGVVTTDM
jgi:phage terminase small subunit